MKMNKKIRAELECLNDFTPKEKDGRTIYILNNKDVLESFSDRNINGIGLNVMNDYTYKYLAYFLDYCEELLDTEEFDEIRRFDKNISENIPAWADQSASVYDSDLRHWQNHHSLHRYYVDEEMEKQNYQDVSTLLMAAQCQFILDYFNSLRKALKKYLELRIDDE